ncbi:MAG: tetratricopeptide repeat protein [Nitrospirales bacterium]|nr:tetratricopeptide repeat protein [Nitrospirales bacterium]
MCEKNSWKTLGRLFVSILLFHLLWVHMVQAQVVLPENPPFFNNPNSKKLVVFVHGLTGDEVNTWSSENPEFFWPEKLAADSEFKNHSVLSFGYASDCGITLNIRELAQRLNITLKELGRQVPFEAVSFVAHSLGGLVVRQYILDQYSETKIDSVVLLSTPNFGSHLSKVPSFFCASAHLKKLNPGPDGYIDNLNDQWRREFRQKVDRAPFHLAAAYELFPTRKLLLSVKVVEKPSAVNFSRHTQAFRRDHIQISKPRKYGDAVYIWTRQQLLQQPRDERVHQFTEAEENRLRDTIGKLQKELQGTDLEEALDLIAKEALDEALTLLSDRGEQEDEEIARIAKIRFATAQVYELKLDYTNALKYYQRAVDLSPNNTLFLNEVGLMFYTLAQYDKAIGYYEKALASDLTTFGPDHPNVARSWNNLGVAWDAKGDYEQAIGYYDQAVAFFQKAGLDHYAKVVEGNIQSLKNKF